MTVKLHEEERQNTSFICQCVSHHMETNSVFLVMKTSQVYLIIYKNNQVYLIICELARRISQKLTMFVL